MKRLFRGWSWEHWYNLAREDIEEAFASVRRAVRLGLYAGLALWVFSGFHTIGPNEAGLETFCGRLLSRHEAPGLRYRMPWPIGAVHRVPVQTQQQVAIGMPAGGLSAAERRGEVVRGVLETSATDAVLGVEEQEDSLVRELAAAGGEKQGYDMSWTTGQGLALLSGDHNLIRVMAVVTYLITDPRQFYYGSEGTDLVLRRAAITALLEEVAKYPVDDVLTTERTKIQDAVRLSIQRVADASTLNLGVQVSSVQLTRVAAPNPVAAAFNAVSTAREERATRIQEARQYAASEVPKAEAAAQRMIDEANSFAADRVAAARGEASRFAGVLREYRQSGRLVGERLRLETLEQIMGEAKKVYVGNRDELTLLEAGGDAPAQP